MDKFKVSVIIPAYNAGQYISETLSSLIAQTYPNWEAIIVNDGSSDNTLDVIRAFDDARITTVSQENKGVKRLAETLNVGLKLAGGELVTMLPADDIWPTTRLEKQVNSFNDQNVVLVHGKMSLIDENSKIIGDASVRGSIIRQKHSQFEALMELLSRNTILQPTVLIRLDTLVKIGGYKQESYMFAEDYPTQLELSLFGEIKFLPEVLAFYRIHPKQMTKQHQYKMIASDRLFVKRFLRRNASRLKKLDGYHERGVRQAMLTRDAYDYYKLGKHFALQTGKTLKVISLLFQISKIKGAKYLTFKLFGVLTYSLLNQIVWKKK